MKNNRLNTSVKSLPFENEGALANLALKVAHDVRSPLTTLKIVLNDLTALPEPEKHLITQAIERIEDIVNGLLTHYRKSQQKEKMQKDSSSNQEHPERLVDLIESILLEKRCQYKRLSGLSIVANYGVRTQNILVNANAIEFQNMLSNLIDNAVEACNSYGTVTLSVSRTKKNTKITLTDAGHGIPQEILPKLTQKGATYGKANGTGLGLFFSKKTVEASGGRLALYSKLGSGTKVEILLPEVSPSKIKLGGTWARR